MYLTKNLIAAVALAVLAACAQTSQSPSRPIQTSATKNPSATALLFRKTAIAAELAPETTPAFNLGLSRIFDVSALAGNVHPANACNRSLTKNIPKRRGKAQAGQQVVAQSMALSGTERDQFLAAQLLDGNMPSFLRQLTPVTFSGLRANGESVRITICVTPDYLAVGDDNDFVRVPLGLPAAGKVANELGFILPTTKMVDAIYTQAQVHLTPSPMQAGRLMSSTNYLWQHNQTVETQRGTHLAKRDGLIAGQKKDLVLSNVLRSAPGRVAIYGWHRQNGRPIQPLSAVHENTYADYSHGIRLVSRTAIVDGKRYPLAELLQDPHLALMISKEGPIAHPLGLMAAVSQK